MRIYLPATLLDLTDPEGLSARPGHIVTAGLQRQWGAADQEEAEHAALLVAARDSMALLDRAGAPPRRVVVAADIDPLPAPAGEHAPVPAPAVPWRRVASFHVDDGDDPVAGRTIRQALATGEMEPVAELDLLWYDATERELLIASLS